MIYVYTFYFVILSTVLYSMSLKAIDLLLKSQILYLQVFVHIFRLNANRFILKNE